MAFQSKISGAKEAAPLAKKLSAPCKLHDIPGCESCHDTVADTSLENDDPDNWMAHKLVFDKDLKGKDLLQRKETVDDYVVLDPRDKDMMAKQKQYDHDNSKKRGSHRNDDSDRKRSHRDDDRRYRSRDDDRKRSRRDDDHHRSSGSRRR
jgi:peptidyl-prolyl cis-trans isomerase SDCCAG10